MKIPKLDQIRSDLLSKHGSLQAPDFHFRWKVLDERPYRSIIDEALTHFFIKDVTDLNQDGSFGYLVRGESNGHWMLQLSMVGRYGVLLRIQDSQVSLLDNSSGDLSEEETVIQTLLRKHEVDLLSGEILVVPIDMKLDYTDPENVRVYQALFSDTDTLPWASRVSSNGPDASASVRRGLL